MYKNKVRENLMKKKWDKISIIICTRNREKDLLNCIGTIVKQSLKPDEIIIVDNGTIFDNKILIKIRKNKIQDVYIKNKKNGTALARNLALEKVKGNIVFFFDDDVILDKDYIKETIKIFEEDKKRQIGIVIGKITNSKKTISILKPIKKIFLLYTNKPYSVLPSGKNITVINGMKKKVNVSWAPSCAIAIRTIIAKKYRFDESFDTFGYGLGEDLDYTYRIGQKYKIIFNPKSKLIHLGSKTSRIHEKNLGFLQVVNRYKFLIKNMDSKKNRICFWWGIIGEMLINCLSTIKYKKTGIYRFLGNIKGVLYLFFNKV